jgi:SAM-dependent methyltransferase
MNDLVESSGYIKKHKKYIDYRTALLKDYVSLQETKLQTTEQLICNFISNESNNILLCDQSISINESLSDLLLISKSWDILKDGDLTGYIYQNLQNCALKKQKGQFFTPDDIVKYIIKGTLEDSEKTILDIKILDPACGSGQFLIGYYGELLNILINRGYPEKKIPGKILENLYGFDTDRTAVKIARSNLAKISGLPVEKINIFESDFLDRSTLPFYNKKHKLKFNIVAGNPPWGSSLKESQKNYYKDNYKSSATGINTFTLFIERALDFIEDKGRISFLLPEAFLNIKAHMASRKFVLENFSIEEISLWGEKFKGVFAPSVSVNLKKETPIKIISNIVKINSNKKSEKNTQRLIPQQSYMNTHENIFNINYSTKSAGIISRIENVDAVFLKDKAKFFLGIVTGDNNRLISDSKTDEQPDPIIIGTDLEQYRINFSNHFFKYDTNKLQQTAPLNLYKSQNKILYKFIGKRLTFARDSNGYFTLNNVNGFIPAIPEIDSDCLVAILNSRIMQYYYEKSFFTVKVLKGNLEKLPIKIPDKEIQKKIKCQTDNLEKNAGDESTARENIEDIIQHIYGINDKEAYSIELPFSSHRENEI